MMTPRDQIVFLSKLRLLLADNGVYIEWDSERGFLLKDSEGSGVNAVITTITRDDWLHWEDTWKIQY